MNWAAAKGEVSIGCSGSPAARLALKAAPLGPSSWLAKAIPVNFDVNICGIHPSDYHVQFLGLNLGHMEDLVERLVRWNLHTRKSLSAIVLRWIRLKKPAEPAELPAKAKVQNAMME